MKEVITTVTLEIISTVEDDTDLVPYNDGISQILNDIDNQISVTHNSYNKVFAHNTKVVGSKTKEKLIQSIDFILEVL